jgi:hypothetical protein
VKKLVPVGQGALQLSQHVDFAPVSTGIHQGR